MTIHPPGVAGFPWLKPASGVILLSYAREISPHRVQRVLARRRDVARRPTQHMLPRPSDPQRPRTELLDYFWGITSSSIEYAGTVTFIDGTSGLGTVSIPAVSADLELTARPDGSFEILNSRTQKTKNYSAR